MIVTTSWDDGHVLDLRLADQLAEFALPATFYPAPRNRELPTSQRLAGRQIAELSRGFEIGSHTLTHPVLPGLPAAQVRQELSESRAILQDLTGQPVDTFCYPRGRADAATAALVREAGYTTARTTRIGTVRAPRDPFLAGTTLETGRFGYQHLPSSGARVMAVARTGPGTALAWARAACALFDRALATDGYYHLWGHSWVLERRGQWPMLRDVLAHVSGRPGVRYLVNSLAQAPLTAQ